MKFISAAEIAGVADYKSIVEALRDGFRTEIESPVRHFHDTSSVAKLMLMPAWSKAWTGLASRIGNPAASACNARRHIGRGLREGRNMTEPRIAAGTVNHLIYQLGRT